MANPVLVTSPSSTEPAPPPVAGEPGRFDVLVYGSEPEGVAAAVTAAERGARTVLITRDERLGGLFVLGELNMLDLRTQPRNYQEGLFDRWWQLVGHHQAFDVRTAEVAFEQLLRAAGVEVRRGVGPAEPLVQDGAVVGVTVDGAELRAAQVIDATADADLAYLAGAAFDEGFERFGVAQRMADTLVLQVSGVDWTALTRDVRARGHSYASVNGTAIWGHFGGLPAAYPPSQPGVRLRGLNLGLQDDGIVLINALLLYGLDPLDPGSLAAGRERGLVEGESIVAYLREHVAGFERAQLAGGAEKLYVRESRHLLAECVLSADDVFRSVVTDLDVAAGGYPMDAQTYTPNDDGFVWGAPDVYGGRLCMMVSPAVDDLWVVGRSGGFDPVAFSSARVVPFGMSMAEAAGVAAALAVRTGSSALDVARSEESVRTVRAALEARGAYLPPVRARPGIGPVQHPNYEAYLTLVGRGLAVGGYTNDPQLDGAVTSLGYAYLLSNVATRFYFDDTAGPELVQLLHELAAPDARLAPEVAVSLTSRAACLLLRCPDSATWAGLAAMGIVSGTEPSEGLTRGQAYEMAAGLARRASSTTN